MPGRRVPGGAAVGRDLDAADHAAAGVGRRAGDGDAVVPPVTVAPAAGEVIVEVGAVVSVDCVAATRPASQRRGLRAHVGEEVDRRLLHASGRPGRPPSWLASRPQDHWTVPAPNTSAPLGARYSVRWWVAVPGAVGRAVVLEH